MTASGDRPNRSAPGSSDGIWDPRRPGPASLVLNDVSIKAQSVPELQEHHPQMVVDNADGVILDHSVEVGTPADAPQLAPAIARIPGRTDRAPTTVAR